MLTELKKQGLETLDLGALADEGKTTQSKGR